MQENYEFFSQMRCVFGWSGLGSGPQSLPMWSGKVQYAQSFAVNFVKPLLFLRREEANANQRLASSLSTVSSRSLILPWTPDPRSCLLKQLVPLWGLTSTSSARRTMIKHAAWLKATATSLSAHTHKCGGQRTSPLPCPLKRLWTV